MVIHEKYNHVTAMEELVPLAMQITRFKLTAAIRKAHRRGEDRAVDVDETPIADPQVDVVRQMEQNEMLGMLRAALPQLGERCREVFRLKLEGKGFAEIQREMGAQSINTVYTWEARCREELKKRIESQRRVQ